MNNTEAVNKLDEALHDYYVSTEYLEPIKMGRDALAEKCEKMRMEMRYISNRLHGCHYHSRMSHRKERNDMADKELYMRKLVRESDVIDKTDGSELAQAFNTLWDKYVEAEPCSDAISRQAAENLFRNARAKLDASKYKTMAEFNLRDSMLLNAEQLIHLLPSVHAEPMRWHYNDFPPSDPEKRYVVVRTNELFVKPILDTADYYTGDGMYSEKPWHLDGGYSCYPSEILAWADVGEIGEIIKHISGKENT